MKDSNCCARPKGFTLVELIVIIVIIGVLAAVITPRIGTSADDAQRVAVKTIAEEVQNRIEAYKAASALKGENSGYGFYPRNEVEFLTLFEDGIVPMHPCDTGLADRLSVAINWSTIDGCPMSGCPPKWIYRVAAEGDPEYPRASFYSYVTSPANPVGCHYNPADAAHVNN